MPVNFISIWSSDKTYNFTSQSCDDYAGLNINFFGHLSKKCLPFWNIEYWWNHNVCNKQKKQEKITFLEYRMLMKSEYM